MPGSKHETRVSPPSAVRVATAVVIGLAGSMVATVSAVAAAPALQLARTIRTTPFTGTSTRMSDGEGSAYVPRDDSLWLADDNAGQVYEVARVTGALKRVISNNEFQAAPRFGGGSSAGSSRAGDLESMAYDPTADVLYAFSGKCCNSSEQPTAFRLTRGGDGRFHVESYQPLPSGSDFTAAALRPSDGLLYVGVGSDLRQYTYASNTVGARFSVSGLSGILGMSFSDDSADLYVVNGSQKLLRVSWATKTLVSGWTFDLTPFGVRDSRAVERIGSQFFVLDGYDGRSSSDPLKYAVFVLNIVGEGTDSTPPDTFIDSGPSGVTSSTSATFTFSASEPGSSFQCRLDGATFAACTSPKSYSALARGAHSFEVKATDAAGNPDTTPATRTWTIDDAPAANTQSISLNTDTTATITLTGSDPNGDALTFRIASLPAHGALYEGTGTGGHRIVSGDLPYTLGGGGNKATYQPTNGYSGPDSFTFKANDGVLDSAPATVSITVNPGNRAPVANADSAATTPDAAVTVAVLSNDTDADNDALTVTGASVPAHGTAAVNPNGTITYTPVSGYVGPDSFTYAISDGHGHSASATVSITVSSGSRPVANDDSATTIQDTPVTIAVLANDTDADNDVLTVTGASIPAHGTAVVNLGAAVTYTPASGYAGPDSFTYAIGDGHGNSASATVSIIVDNVNDPPHATNDTATTSRDTPVTISVLSNDTDADNDTLAVTGASIPAHGTAAVNPNGTITYAPASGYVGPDSFTYAISDGHGGVGSATVAVSVTSAANLIANTGFETDTSGWQPGNSFNTLGRVAGGHSGGWAAQLSTTSAGSHCTLDDKPSWVTTTQSGPYIAGIWVRSDTPGLTFKLRIREYQSGVEVGKVSTSVTLTSSWQLVSVAYTPNAPGQSNLDFQAFTVNSPVGVCFQADDASIKH